MDTDKKAFLIGEFLTMSVFGALGRSNTYADSVLENDKNTFRNALREKLRGIGSKYVSPVTEEMHLSNILELANDLSSRFPHFLKKGRFRISIAQKALNLYLKYLWCVGIISTPPHCPFDSIVIGYLPECRGINWTDIDTIEAYSDLVSAAKNEAANKSIAEWELGIWLVGMQSKRSQNNENSQNMEKEREGKPKGSLKFKAENKRGSIMIKGTITSQGKYANGKDICEIHIDKVYSSRLSHSYGQKTPIQLSIGHNVYEAGIHVTKEGVVWISSVLQKKGPRAEKIRLVEALTDIGLKKGDRVSIVASSDGTLQLQ